VREIKYSEENRRMQSNKDWSKSNAKRH